jgi:hypothetical protein
MSILSIWPEALPVAGGALVGVVARFAYQRTHRWSYVAGVLLVALCATIFSGEFRQSWGFLVDDVVVASLSACGAFLVTGVAISRRTRG